jgi:uncharacterized membrane protein YgcG
MPANISLSTSRRRLLSSLANKCGGPEMRKRYLGLPAAAAGLTLLLAGTIGANAATGGAPMGEVLGVLGLGATPGDTHGTAVSTAVGDAIASSTPGVDRGEAVSLAACLAAHDRSTLPAGAQVVLGQEENEPKVCATETPTAEEPAGEEPVEEPAEEPADGTATAEATATPTHGQTVSDAVHAAIESSTPGAGKGPAVSEAACTAAHDRSTLPAAAQDAAGQLDREPKDCTHPSATETPEPTGSETEPATDEGSEEPDAPGNGNAGGNGNGGNAGGSGNGGGGNGNFGGNPNKP